MGLMPTSTGKPGGRRTGDQMSDYAIEGGPFLAACAALMTERFTISWYDRFPASTHVAFGDDSLGQNLPAAVGGGRAPVRQNAALASAVVAPAFSSLSPATLAAPGQAEQSGQVQPINRSNRLKYGCSGCGANVWGKPGLSIICGACEVPFGVG